MNNFKQSQRVHTELVLLMQLREIETGDTSVVVGLTVTRGTRMCQVVRRERAAS